MPAPAPIAVLVNDDGDEPFLRVLRTTRSIDAARARGGLLIGVDGRRLPDTGAESDANDERRAEDPSDSERLARAHQAMTRRIGLPDPDLPDSAAHVAAITYVSRLGLQRLKPIEDLDGVDDDVKIVVKKLKCLGCGLAGMVCSGCPKLW